MTLDCVDRYVKQEPSLAILKQKWSKTLVGAKPLSGGLTNQCWKVTTQCGHHYVWRPHSLSTETLSISRTHEYQVLTALQQADFAPNVEALFPEGLLVEWIEGVTLCDAMHCNTRHCNTRLCNTTKGDSLDLVMKSLSDLHQYQPVFESHSEIKEFDYRSCIMAYWASLPAQTRTSIHTQRFERFYADCERLLQQTTALEGRCLCHFDLGDYNIIQKPNADLVIIDWEYAALSNPIIDMTISILAGQFDIDESLKSYSKHRTIDLKSWKNLAQRWVPFLRFMTLLWHQVSLCLHGRASDRKAIEILDKQLRADGF